MKNITSKDFEAFESEYRKEEKEILALISDANGAAACFFESWATSQYFWAYVDIASNELKKGDGRINWLISEEDMQKYGMSYPHYFKNGVVYRLKVRELIDQTVPEGRLPSYYNRFMLVNIIEENVHNDDLLAVLAEYRKPVTITDKAMGEFFLDKNLSLFNGKINWCGKSVSVSLEVNINSKGTWTKAMKVLRSLHDNQEEQDVDFRTFITEQLVDSANDWRVEDDTKEITKKDFADRISLSELSITSSGEYTAYYDDDDIFANHAITVNGSIKNGMESANLAG